MAKSKWHYKDSRFEIYYNEFTEMWHLIEFLGTTKEGATKLKRINQYYKYTEARQERDRIKKGKK